MSENEAYDRLARQIRRLPFAVNVTRKVTQGATQILDFDIGFPDGSMRAEEGRVAEILGSSVVMSHGTIDDFLLRFPPVSGEYADPDELREVMEAALRGTPYEEEVEIEINPDSPNGNEWTPHVVARTWPPYPDVDDFVETLRQAFDHYEEAVFDPDVARFMAPDEPEPEFADQLRRVADSVTVDQRTFPPKYTFRLDIEAGTESMPVEQNIPSNLSGTPSTGFSGTLRPPIVSMRAVSSPEVVADKIRDLTPVAIMDVRVRRTSSGRGHRPHVVVQGIGPDGVTELIEDLEAGFADAFNDPDLNFRATEGDSPAQTPGSASDKQGSGVGFQAPGDTADLFHVTRTQDAESIARDGLLPNSPTATEKRAYEDAGQDPRDPSEPMIEEPRDTQADRIFDEAVRDAKYATDNEQYPDHEFAVFFWTREEQAVRTADDDSLRSIVVAVDSSKLPSGCKPAAGNIRPLDTLWQDIWRGLGPSGEIPSDERMLDFAGEYWDSVEWYEPGVEPGESDTEVFMQCTVPPAAIEAIYNPETGRVLYEPADADQRTLREFSSP